MVSEELAQEGVLGVMSSARQNCGGVVLIPCPIPQQQRARDVAFGGSEFCGEDAAADLEAHGGIAERRERFVGEAVLASDLAHHLHQSPRKRTSARFSEVGESAASDLGRHVFFVERRLIAQRPRIPGGLLLDDGAHQFRPEPMRVSGAMCELKEFCGGRQRVFSLAKGLATMPV